MVDIATLLSKQFEFVRIDLYSGNDSLVYFSEFTFTPNGGTKITEDFDTFFIDEWV